MSQLQYSTRDDMAAVVDRKSSKVPFKRGLQKVLRSLDTRRGIIYLSSGYEYPGAVFALGYRLHLPAARDRRVRPPRRIPAAE